MGRDDPPVDGFSTFVEHVSAVVPRHPLLDSVRRDRPPGNAVGVAEHHVSHVAMAIPGTDGPDDCAPGHHCDFLPTALSTTFPEFGDWLIAVYLRGIRAE